MNNINRLYTNAKKRPIKIIQFGEGNFLRAFADYFVDIANNNGYFNGNIVLVKSIAYGSTELFNKQECQYTVFLRGLINGELYEEKRIITSVDSICDCTVDFDSYLNLARIDSVRFIISNTTEAGIQCNNYDNFEDKPAYSYPAKLTQFLYERAKTFKYDESKGLIILPVELIDNNGDKLKQCVLDTIKKWNLDNKFEEWIINSCIFANTLVDRIVTGYPKNEIEKIWEKNGIKDELLVTAEPFALWVIESDKPIQKEFPLDSALENKKGMNIIFTDNYKPYKERKVRILNGAHTSFSLASYLAGNNTVLESINDSIISHFIKETIYKEIIPTLDLEKNELISFANEVINRFKNPFIKHELISISLNSVSKWKTRCLPSLKKFILLNNQIPNNLCFSLAALISFYRGIRLEGGYLIGLRNDCEYKIQDEEKILKFFNEYKNSSETELVNEFFNLTNILDEILLKKEIIEKVIYYVIKIRSFGVTNTIIEEFGYEK